MGPESTDPLLSSSTSNSTATPTVEDGSEDTSHGRRENPPPSFADILTTDIEGSAQLSPSDPPPPYPIDSENETETEIVSRHRTRRGDGREHGHGARISTSTTTSSSVAHPRTGSSSLSGDQFGRVETEDEARISPIVRSRSEGYHATSPSETTPLLTPRVPQHAHGHGHGVGRSRSHSYTSTLSAAPSLARTVRELFQTDDATDFAEGGSVLGVGGPGIGRISSTVGGCASTPTPRPPTTEGLGTRWKRYFRPMARKVYYKSFFHLLLVNFPYALLAWVYLFVFTVTGTTLLVALPLGAVLCFFNLLGARALAAGELKLQITFHAPLGHHRPLPYPPRPIFVRQRPILPSEVEASGDPMSSGYMVPERSFYKNTYAMFTDSTSYQALFYFLVVKPAITLLVTILFWGLGVPLFVLVVPAPSVLRAARRIGIWQASVAIEGLYLAVR